MKKLLMILPLVFLLCFTFGCQKAEEVAEEPGVKALSTEDLAAIKALAVAFDEAALAGEFDKMVGMMTEDTVLMSPNIPIIEGRTGISEFLKAFETATITEHKIELLEIDGYGDIAYARGVYKETIVLEGVPEPIKDEGKNLLILRKQSDGSWLISIFCSNSDLSLTE